MPNTSITHTFDTIKPNPANISITPTLSPSTTKKPPRAQDIDPKDLLKQIQSIKTDILNHCKTYMDKEMKQMYDKQKEQNKKLEDIIKKNEEQQAITLKMIQELTSIVTSMSGSQQNSSPMKTKDVNNNKASTSEEMDIEKESHKRKDHRLHA